MSKIAKYQKKPIIIDAELFQLGMEDGFKDSLESLGEGIRGVKHVRKPFIKTLEGEYIVEVGKHFIVTGIKGERYPVEVSIFHELYDLVEGAKKGVSIHLPGNSSIYGTENLECLIGIINERNKKESSNGN